jgi:hypothetical protein
LACDAWLTPLRGLALGRHPARPRDGLRFG